MKLLFDQNLSPKLVKRLSDLYPDSNHVYYLGIDLASDKEMREYAGREGFVIVTKDSDFSDLCILAEEIAVLTTSKQYFAIISPTSKVLAWTKSWEF